MTKSANGMGSVYPVNGGKWRAAIIGADGTRKARTRATENQAKKALKELLAERDAFEASGVVAPASLTVGDVLDSWYELDLPNRNRAPSTVLTYGYMIANLKREIGTLRTAGLRVRDLDNAFTRLAEDGRLNKATLVKTRGVLAQAFDFAVKREEMARNPARSITLPVTARPSRTGKAMTVEQAKAFLVATADHRWHALFVVAINLGLRPGELTALCWDHVDFDKGTITIGRGMRVTMTGKMALSDEVKTGRSRRTLAMPAAVRAAMEQHRARQREDDLSTGVRSDLVFRTSVGTPIANRNLAREIETITEALGFGIGWTPNEMRHTAASILVDQGVPLVTVADILGHTTTRMLELTYRKNLRPEIDGGVAAMDALFGGPQANEAQR